MLKKTEQRPVPETQDELLSWLKPEICQHIGSVLDTQRQLANLGSDGRPQLSAQLRIALHPDVWPIAKPIVELLQSHFQGSVDSHALYRSLPIKFHVSVVPSPVSSGGWFSIQLDGKLFPVAGEDRTPDPISSSSELTVIPSRSESDQTKLPLNQKTEWVLELIDESGQPHLPLSPKFTTIGRRPIVEAANAADFQLVCDSTISRRQIAIRVLQGPNSVIEIVNIGANPIVADDVKVPGFGELQPPASIDDVPALHRSRVNDGARIVLGMERPLELVVRRLGEPGTPKPIVR